MKYNYFYGSEADMFSFYRIPKILFSEVEFRELSTDAKVLYGLMLDRMSLSLKNQWIDSEGRVYINFSVENIVELLNCSKNKAIALLKELDSENGIGLIEKKRQGQGKPTIIYVKNFISEKEVQNRKKRSSEENKAISEVQKMDFQKFTKSTSKSAENELPEVKKMRPNNTKINNTDCSKKVSNLFLSPNEVIGSDEINYYVDYVHKQLDIKILYERYPYEKEILDGICDMILEILLCQNKTIVIAGGKYPTELVKSKFMKLNYNHIVYVMGCLETNTTKISNIKKYMLAALFNAPTTIRNYYQAEINHDMPQLAL